MTRNAHDEQNVCSLEQRLRTVLAAADLLATGYGGPGSNVRFWRAEEPEIVRCVELDDPGDSVADALNRLRLSDCAEPPEAPSGSVYSSFAALPVVAVFSAEFDRTTLFDQVCAALKVPAGSLPVLLTCVQGVVEAVCREASDSTVEADQISNRFQIILSQIEEHTSHSIRSVRTLSDPEWHRLVQEPNDTARPFSAELSLGALFLRAASNNSERQAVRFASESLTYDELKRRAESVAGFLRKSKVLPGATVGIFSDRSLDSVTAILGTVLAGCVYVPLSPEWPQERLRLIAELADLSCIIDCDDGSSNVANIGRFVAPITEVIAGDPCADALECRAGADRLYILFTSGSTGEPKGVEVTHRGVSRLVFDKALHPIEPGQTVMHAAPLTFDASTKEIWLPLLNGGCIEGFAKEEVLTVDRFIRTRQDRPVDFAFFTTALFESLLDQDGRAFSGIQHVYVGGESPRPDLFSDALQQPGFGRLIHCYGPTETTVYALAEEVSPDTAATGAVPLGKPIGNTTVYVLDAYLRPVPPEAEGEIYIGGAGVALGYLGDEDKTRRHFVSDPFSQESVGRLYRTGDRGAYLPDGRIRFCGRYDNQVKIRGHRIEPEEIQEALHRLQQVDRALVRTHRPSDGDRRLIAWVKLLEGVPSDRAGTEVLKRELAKLLPDYMIPSWILPVAEFPFTPHGKIDSRKLPLPSDQAPVKSEEIDAGDIEGGLTNLFRNALLQENFGPEDSFLVQGGNSLLAVRLVQRIQEIWQEAPPISLFYETATVSAIASYIQLARWGRQTVPPVSSQTSVRL